MRTERGFSYLLWLAAVAVVSAGVFACGTDSGGESVAATTDTGHSSPPKQSRRGDTGRSAEGKKSSCSSASVRLSPAAPAAIDFNVRCKSTSEESTVRFAVSRASIDGQEKPGIRAFRRRPTVVAVDGSQRYGLCRKTAFGELDCSAEADRSVLVSGRLWVNPKTLCDFEVVVFLYMSPDCKYGSVCPGKAVRVTLAQGRPRGC